MAPDEQQTWEGRYSPLRQLSLREQMKELDKSGVGPAQSDYIRGLSGRNIGL
jgi:hypothetical protein